MPMTNFRAEDMPGAEKGAKPTQLPAPPVEEAPPPPPPPPDPAAGVPVGTAPEILAWVGDDPARAREALRVEKGNTVKRNSLIARLEKIAAGK